MEERKEMEDKTEEMITQTFIDIGIDELEELKFEQHLDSIIEVAVYQSPDDLKIEPEHLKDTDKPDKEKILLINALNEARRKRKYPTKYIHYNSFDYDGYLKE